MDWIRVFATGRLPISEGGMQAPRGTR
jgi:hypothetical protein